ncbi:MAG: putative patatin/cPLA2 family phospholipase [Salibacteraceae bacterium]|jgi:predicted patatin/cPLA2 family phospholipase
MKGKKVLILEGGGFRTGFSAGVMDAFHDNNHRDFDGYIGVSGGTVAVSYFLSEQRHKYIDALCHLVNDSNFIKMTRAFNKKGIMDIDYFHEVSGTIIPFDFDLALKNIESKELIFVLTHRKTGTPYYFSPSRDNWISSSIASCTLPVVTKGKHHFDGDEYFDGGWSDAIPVKWAYENGAKEITVVRTKQISDLQSKSILNKLAAFGSRKNDVLREVFNTNHERYNQTLEFMKNPPKDLIIHQIAPDKPLASGGLAKSTDELLSDHSMGVRLGNAFLVRVGIRL